MTEKNDSTDINPAIAEDPRENGSCHWRSPSNIALVKYWGKSHEQIPRNPSISFTLRNAHTNTLLEWKLLNGAVTNAVDFTFYFHGEKKKDFSHRIGKYLNRMAEEIPLLRKYHLTISSENTFPHSSGIASSASAMSALAATLVDMESQILEKDGQDKTSFFRRISFLSRLGSGSACRSIFPQAALWGKSAFPHSDDAYAVGLDEILNPVFHDYRDAILLVDQGEKSVSSSAGHQLMEFNPYAGVRYDVARQNTEKLLTILKSGDLDDFTSLVEEEAMTLHALMMASSPGYILMHPNTIEIIHATREFRKDSGIPVCFTLDAGPNVHLLYPASSQEKVKEFIVSDLVRYCTDNRWIDDKMGPGIQKLPL
ncbi:MAG TPA: hypothetical protein VKZ54_11905 [Membranihabitans sp.]|nr:hypothetical protein [Membranihabitans sp.]